MELFEIKNLTYKYPESRKEALDDISFEIEKGSFNVICGATGSGKTTLLRMLKNELRPVGDFTGEIYYKGRSIHELTARESASKIGFVLQNPEEQIVTDKVWHELAFGPENIGLDKEHIRRMVAETASYFGIEDWFERSVNTLSGGEKQLLNLAAVMTLSPEVLILDEPTAQLDPIAASDFISTINKLNKDLGLTIIMTEHRLEEVISCSDKLLIMEEGRILAYGNTKEVIKEVKTNSRIIEGMPAAVQIVCNLQLNEEIPLNVREGRRLLENNYSDKLKNVVVETYSKKISNPPVLEVEKISFRYERDAQDIIKNLSFNVFEGEILCVLGGNGAGKSTTLLQIAGLLKPYEGKIKINGRKLKDYKGQELYRGIVGLLPQDVKALFIEYTVREELKEVNCDVEKLPFDISGLLDKHPYDLSGGEQQLVGLAKVLSTNPKLLLMDEPTKGLDAHTKSIIIDVMNVLKQKGVTIVCVTHDIEFAAKCADRCALLFRGEMTSIGTTNDFFGSMKYYTTAVNKMTKGLSENIITVEQLVDTIKNNENGK